MLPIPVSQSRQLIATLTFCLAFLLATPVFAQCVWRGTAPFCEGRCDSGMVVTRRESQGCATGSKALCCPPETLPADSPQAFCENYAKGAIYYAQQAVNDRCGFTGPRWTTDKEAHRKWCLSLNGNQKPANDEQEARRTGIVNCVAGCSEYARDAESAAGEAEWLGCGFTGPRWSDNDDDHYVWCVHGNQGANAKAETAAREAQLAQCRQAHQCTEVGQNDPVGGGSSDPKKKFSCTNAGGGKKLCCFLTVP